MQIFLILIFCVFCVCDLLAIMLKKQSARYVTKPPLMLLLAAIYIVSAASFNYYIVAALLLGFFGDVAMLRSSRESFLMSGMASFLIGHILYIIAFLQATDCLSGMPLVYLTAVLPYAAIIFALVKILKPHLGSMLLPVSVYASVILLMSLAAFLRGYVVTGGYYWYPLIGSVLFMLSDAILAFFVFKQKSGDSKVSIMLTYILAQVFIVLGFI